MIRKSAFALFVAAMASTSAWAEGPIESPPPIASSLTRADVMADYSQFRKAGVNPWSSSYNMFRSTNKDLTRAQVADEYRSSREMTNALYGEDSGSAYKPRMQRRATRQIASYDAPAN